MSAEVFEAVVVTGADPLGQGRARVVIPQVSGDAISTWALPTVRTYGPPPAPGSTVWVSLDTGDPSKPVYHAAGLYSPWIAIPSSWMSASWNHNTGAYRLGPGGAVEFRGEVTTTTSPVSSATAVLTLPAALQPAQQPASFGVAVLPGGSANSTPAVARVDSAIKVYGANWTFTGTYYLALPSIRYSTI